MDREIPLDDYTDEGHQFYLSLMRGDLQVRQGDTVYVLRDIPIDAARPDVSRRDGDADQPDLPKTKRLDRKKVKNVPKGKDEAVTSKVSFLFGFEFRTRDASMPSGRTRSTRREGSEECGREINVKKIEFIRY